MAILQRPEGDLFYDVVDIVPPWQPKETILFLNGLAIDSDIWITWLPLLVDRYRIVRTDLRGFGRSFRPAEGAAWSMALIADDVQAVMEATNTDRVHFVGESTGGTLGIFLAIERPSLLLSLTTVTAAHAGGSIGQSKQLRDDVGKLGMDAWSAKMMTLRFHENALSEPMYDWFHTTQRGSTPHACIDLVDMLVSTDLTHGLGQVKTPTLILAPDNSPFVSVEQQVERLRTIPHSTLQIVENSRHGIAHSHGPECANALRGFLDRLSDRASQ